jgi:hypothetical protein
MVSPPREIAIPRTLFAAAFTGTLTLSALAPARAQPWTLSSSPAGIAMRWYSDTNDEAQAHGIAGAYCSEMGRVVRLGAIEQDGSAVIAHYRCF